MDNRLLIASDLHNTLLCSSEAWERAFFELSGCDQDMIKGALTSKYSRHQLAADLELSYDDVYNRYSELVKAKANVWSVIALLQRHYAVVLISSASMARIERDITKITPSIRFDRIYSKETFQKSLPSDWEKLRVEFGADKILYFGNDPGEDVPPVDFVQTVLV